VRERERGKVREREDERVATLHTVTAHFIVTTLHIPVIWYSTVIGT
jgi:hypothetical protein